MSAVRQFEAERSRNLRVEWWRIGGLCSRCVQCHLSTALNRELQSQHDVSGVQARKLDTQSSNDLIRPSISDAKPATVTTRRRSRFSFEVGRSYYPPTPHMEPCRGFAEEVGAVRHPDERGFTEGHVFWHADARRAGLLATIDRIRDPPTAQELKRHAERS
jgi:hypothetical protein